MICDVKKISKVGLINIVAAHVFCDELTFHMNGPVIRVMQLVSRDGISAIFQISHIGDVIQPI